MRDGDLTAEERALRQYDTAGEFPSIDIRSAVMARITTKSTSEPGIVPMSVQAIPEDEKLTIMEKVELSAGHKPRRRNAALRRRISIAAACSVLLLAAGTGYYNYQDDTSQATAIPYVQKAYEPLIDKEHNFKISLKDQADYTEQTQNADPVIQEKQKEANEEVKQLMEQLQPGEMAAFATHTGAENELPLLYVAQPFSYEKYSDYESALAEWSAPELRVPDNLPEGYKFAQGLIAPPSGTNSAGNSKKNPIMFLGEASSPEGTEPSDTLTVWRNIKWDQAERANLIFKKGQQTLKIGAFAYKPGQASNFYTNGMSSTENIRIQLQNAGSTEDHELIYLEAAADDKVYFKHMLLWMDRDAQVSYQLHDSGDSQLTKEQLIQIAGSVMK
ncbi:hypothetical protein [Paenibacillus donghaensis]|uniref:DUF4367 domain-containing protein n=1 Tax=Paenibacillus donghaensis TaxID=414771 RepID=A0A2Z2KTR9_9BACL|nr:hypothetical protein [Paenibacillus donghaensis]ASA25312.1 hypothetical protein B9T62_34025 [Paenibacillus donghaensis]